MGSLLKEVTLSSPLLNVKSSVTLRKSSAMLPLTLNKKWPPLLHPHHWKNHMNFQTVKLSPSVTNVSDAQKPFSNHHSLVWNPLVLPLCTQVLLIVCKRKSPPLLHLP